jgi:serine phosphatase RsbU (regulator of sigma subunit)
VTLMLDRGDQLVCYTDGLSESFNSQGKLLDVPGIKRILVRPVQTTQETMQALIAGEAEHRGSGERRDDLTILTFGFR